MNQPGLTRRVRRSLFSGVTVLTVSVGLSTLLCASGIARAATAGSNLSAPANDSVCEFQAYEPKTRICTVGQESLVADHWAPDGIRAPFDGIVVSWSVLSGTALPGTGLVKLALRTTDGELVDGAKEVELPLSAPGTRYSFAERMPVAAGQPLGLRVSISNRSVEEAGAPIAFGEEGIGVARIWMGDPWRAPWDTEEDTELLFNAVIEPDGDDDGYGDVTQDCFPNHPGDQELCGKDLVQPIIRTRYARRQSFLRSGLILVRITSNEVGIARGRPQLEIHGRGGRSYILRSVRKQIAAGGEVVLRLKLRKAALRAAKAAAKEGREVSVTARVGVVDASRNAREVSIRVRLRSG
jgi:hypothetical protein